MKKTNHTNEELAEALVFPVSLTPAQQAEAAEALATFRKKVGAGMSDADVTYYKLRSIRFQIEDYLASKDYDPALHFGYFLKQYIAAFGMKRKDFATAISIDETLLSQFINQHRAPPDYISIRLELHSNDVIPADYWYRLVGKHKLYQIQTDKSLRKKEKKFVHKIKFEPRT